MNGLMVDYPLTLTHILERSAKISGLQEISSRLPDGSMHRYTYREFHRRVHRLAYNGWASSPGIASGRSAGTASVIWNYISQFPAPTSRSILSISAWLPISCSTSLTMPKTAPFSSMRLCCRS
jgi:YD repeat-containing protein